MSKSTERWRDAARVNERHEVRRDGNWVRVTRAMTLSTLRGALRVRDFQLADGTNFGVRLPGTVMSRLPKSEASE